mmetsp:Transcript_6656/g.16520  ORF Transcript_6656/g.16520 Transcript_6656/m.16520 type:complete len:395 (+) Transcript_6656:975-2159(+)
MRPRSADTGPSRAEWVAVALCLSVTSKNIFCGRVQGCSSGANIAMSRSSARTWRGTSPKRATGRQWCAVSWRGRVRPRANTSASAGTSTSTARFAPSELSLAATPAAIRRQPRGSARRTKVAVIGDQYCVQIVFRRCAWASCRSIWITIAPITRSRAPSRRMAARSVCRDASWPSIAAWLLWSMWNVSPLPSPREMLRCLRFERSSWRRIWISSVGSRTSSAVCDGPYCRPDWTRRGTAQPSHIHHQRTRSNEASQTSRPSPIIRDSLFGLRSQRPAPASAVQRLACRRNARRPRLRLHWEISARVASAMPLSETRRHRQTRPCGSRGQLLPRAPQPQQQQNSLLRPSRSPMVPAEVPMSSAVCNVSRTPVPRSKRRRYCSFRHGRRRHRHRHR